MESFGCADLIIDYTKDQWDHVDALKGIGAVFDDVGEKLALERAKTILKEQGSFITIVSHQYGFDPSAYPPLKFASSFIFDNDATVQDKLAELIEEEKMKIVVEKTFPFTQEGVTDMIASQQTGKNKGKSIIEIAA